MNRVPTSPADRRSVGFTLVELLVASAVFTIVAAGLFAAYIGGGRMLRHVFAEAELSIRTRELRDKLLFHAAPDHDGAIWAGLLSGTNANAFIEGNGEKILLRCTALTGSAASPGTTPQTIQLVFRDADTEKCRLFSEDRIDERWPARWLHPGRLDFFAGESSPQDILVADQTDPGRFYINVTARKQAGGLMAVHNERIVVPVFGRVQRTESNGRGGL